METHYCESIHKPSPLLLQLLSNEVYRILSNKERKRMRGKGASKTHGKLRMCKRREEEGVDIGRSINY
jgi:hypothetical protein